VVAGAVCSILGLLISLGLGAIPATDVTVALVVALVLVAYFIGRHYNVRSLVLSKIRRQLLYALTSIVIEMWETTIKIDENGDANVANRINGKVNFGINRWIPTRIRPETAQGSLGVSAIDNISKDALLVEPTLVTPKFTELRIHFPQELKRGEKFNIILEYDVKGTFFFDKEDFYGHRANHYEKRVSMVIDFPNTVSVSNVHGEVLTEHGDVWQDTARPHLDHSRRGGDRVTWMVNKAYYGNTHTMKWTSRTVSPSTPRTPISTT